MSYNLSAVTDLESLGVFFNTATGEIGWTAILFTLFIGMFIWLYRRGSNIALSVSALISVLIALPLVTLGWISQEVFTMMAVIFLGSLIVTYVMRE